MAGRLKSADVQKVPRKKKGVRPFLLLTEDLSKQRKEESKRREEKMGKKQQDGTGKRRRMVIRSKRQGS